MIFDSDRLNVEKKNFHKELVSVVKECVEMGAFSKDGQYLALVDNNLTISILDTSFVWVHTRDYDFFGDDPDYISSINASTIFIDWSATGRYLYYIVETQGFIIDVYKGEIVHKFTYVFVLPFGRLSRLDTFLYSFMCHPTVDDRCLVISGKMVYEINYRTNEKRTICDYTELMSQYIPKSSNAGAMPANDIITVNTTTSGDSQTQISSKDSSQALNSSVAPNTTKRNPAHSAYYINNSKNILLWNVNHIFIYDPEHSSVLAHESLKISSPCMSKLSIEKNGTFFVVANRSEISSFTLPDLRQLTSYKDSVNQLTWKSCCLNSDASSILCIPTGTQTGGPVYSIYNRKDNTKIERHTQPSKKLKWGIYKPDDDTIVICTLNGELYQYKDTYSTNFAVYNDEDENDCF